MILDTNAVSGLFLGDEALAELLAGTNRHHLPTIVIGEYRYGLARSTKRVQIEALLEELIQRSAILPIDVETATHYATVRDALRRKGTPIPENDVWIAALARQHHLAVASRDEHFDRVPGIVRNGW